MRASPNAFRQDAEVIGLVGFAHMVSHFFQLVLAPLFPLIKDEFDTSYAALGLMVAVLYTVSGISQTMAGFVVDRFGPRRVLLFGLAASSLALLLSGLATSYWMLVAIALLAGVGNAVFHPADFAILNAKVSPSRLGHAYSTHGIGGNFGWMLAPIFSVGISSAYGWRAAAIAAGVLGLLCAGIIASRAVLADTAEEAGTAHGAIGAAKQTGLRDSVRLLLAWPVLKCFAFFTFYAMALVGMQTFAVPVIAAYYGVPLVAASTALTGFLFGGVVGIVAGGFAAAHSERHNRVAAGGMLGGAAFTLFLASGATPVWLLVVAMTLVGFFTFSTQPSRDILVRAATPPGATGKVYGFVYSGLDLGGSLSPLLFGWLLDAKLPQWVLGMAACFMLLAVATVVTLHSELASEKAPA